ncbi:MAG: ATP-binding protein [Thermodesulfobacteriota bacterium]
MMESPTVAARQPEDPQTSAESDELSCLHQQPCRWFQEISTAVPVGLVLHRRFVIRWVNPTFCQMLGLAETDLLNTCLLQWMDAPVRGEMVRLYRKAYFVPFEIVLHRTDDIPLTCNVTTRRVGFAFHPFYLSVFSDITQTKRLTQKLWNVLDQKRHLETVIQESPAIAYVERIDVEPPFEYISENIQRWGFSPADVEAGKIGPKDWIHPDDRNRVLHERHLALHGAGRRFSLEYRVLTHTGDIRWIDDRIVLVRKAGMTTLYGLMFDVTARKVAEERLRQANAELEKRIAERTAELVNRIEEVEDLNHRLTIALEQAKIADKLKSAFITTMTHEVRTPLHAIIGFSELLQKEGAGPLNTEQHKRIEIVLENARRLLDLFEDVLQLSRIDAGLDPTINAPVNPELVIQQVLEKFEQKAAAKGNRLLSKTSKQFPILMLDLYKLSRILFLLIDNGIKFTTEGTVSITARWQETDQKLEIEVADTGIGIPAEDIPRMFQPFTQADTGYSRNFGGTGLGLTLVEKLVKQMGGSIQVESEPGKGSRFRVILPSTLASGSSS